MSRILMLCCVLLLAGCVKGDNPYFKKWPLASFSLPKGVELTQDPRQFHARENAPRKQWLLAFNYEDSWTDIWNHVEHCLAENGYRELIFDSDEGREKRDWHRVYYSRNGLREAVLAHSMDAKAVGLAPLKSQYFFLLTEYQQQPDVLSYVGAESRDGKRIKLQELK